jgi:hypothetical protein
MRLETDHEELDGLDDYDRLLVADMDASRPIYITINVTVVVQAQQEAQESEVGEVAA